MNKLILLLLLITSAHAETPKSKCSFSAKCTLDKKEFELKFNSPSEDCTEDDMELVFQSGRFAQKFNIPKNWYTGLPHIAEGGAPVCGDMPAFQTGKNQILVFVKSSGRPSYDKVEALLIDTDKGALLDHKVLGQSKNEAIAIIPTKTGYKVQIVREYLKNVKCDCDASFVDDWLEVTVQKKKIANRWL